MDRSQPHPSKRMAVTGMSVESGAMNGLQAFQEALFLGVAIGHSEQQSPSAAATELVAVIQAAIQDAGLDDLSGIPLLLSSDGIPETLLQEQTAPLPMAVTLFPAISTSLGSLLEAAETHISRGSKSVAIAVCQYSQNPLAADPQKPGLSFDANGLAPQQNGAMACIVLSSAAANPDPKQVYAWIVGYATLSDPDPGHAVRSVCQQALQNSQRRPEQIGSLEVSAFGEPVLNEAEITGLSQGYHTGSPILSCAVGSSTAILGNTGCAAGLVGLVRQCLSLSQRLLPVVPNWTGLCEPEAWDQTPFYFPEYTRTWFNPADGSPRAAAVNHIGPGSTCTHVILSETGNPGKLVSTHIHTLGVYLLPVLGENSSQLLDALGQLREQISQGADLDEVFEETIRFYENNPEAPYAVGLMGHNREELLREIEFASKGVQKSFENGGEWQSPGGSYLTSQPLGKDVKVAFVYPGAFNSYLGIGKDLFYAFPGLYDRFAELTANVGAVLHEEKLYARSRSALTPYQLEDLETDLNQDPIAMLTSGAALAVFYTLILQEWFGINPGCVFGYSLGETSMMFASQAWTRGEISSAALEASPLFRTRIAGPKETVREFWGLTEKAAPGSEPNLWNNYILMAPADQVYPAIQPGDPVYLTHINTPRQVVIGGNPQACEKVIQTVGCPSLKAPFDHVLHCEAMAAEYNTLVDLSTWPIQNKPLYPLYSAADYQPIRLESQAVGRSIAKMLCTPLDFPRLINLAYQDGAKVFIELGAGSNCTRWIDDTLKGQPHAAISINRKGLSDPESFLRTLARLVSHRTVVKLSCLSSTPTAILD